MDEEQFERRSVYVTPQQKIKLIELVAQHPELVTCNVSEGFSYKDSHFVWKMIANECNSLLGPDAGARKTWRQWRKTWQDLRSHLKRRQQEANGELPPFYSSLTPSQIEALGLKNVSSTTNSQETPEFITLEQDNSLDINNESEFRPSFSEPESPPERKVFDIQKERKKVKTKQNMGDSNKCGFNCDSLAACEKRNLEIKEDYYNFKKDYLQQKLILMREQSEALKCIANELSKSALLKNVDSAIFKNMDTAKGEETETTEMI